ncbi:MAG: hypothetical protein GX489_06900 [Firmicutes bacterium]|jgi:hypothetical protein|nr:hypothetical protein [Bacillota bacterium]
MRDNTHQLAEEDLKAMLAQIAEICMSPEFQSLRRELETIYQRAQAENAGTIAFQDALYALLIQNDDAIIRQPRWAGL